MLTHLFRLLMKGKWIDARVARLKEELEAIEKWEKTASQPDSIGQEARKLRRSEIVRELESIEQRRHPRFKLDVEIKIHSRTAGLLSGRTGDISESGVSAMLIIEAALNEVVQLEFMLPGGFVAVDALVRQRNCFRYGFQFVEPNPAQELIRQTCRDFSIEQSIADFS